MPWCENKACGKTGLKPEEIEFDEDKKRVLCKECYEKRAEIPTDTPFDLLPTLKENWPFSYELHVTSSEGVKAQVKFGEFAVGFHAPNEELRKLLGLSDGT